MLYADEPLLCVSSFFPPQRRTPSSLPLTNSTALAFHPHPPSPPQPGQPTNLPARQLSRYVTRRGPKVPIRPISPLVQRVACAAASPSFSQQRTRHHPHFTPRAPPWIFPLSSEELTRGSESVFGAFPVATAACRVLVGVGRRTD